MVGEEEREEKRREEKRREEERKKVVLAGGMTDWEQQLRDLGGDDVWDLIFLSQEVSFSLFSSPFLCLLSSPLLSSLMLSQDLEEMGVPVLRKRRFLRVLSELSFGSSLSSLCLLFVSFVSPLGLLFVFSSFICSPWFCHDCCFVNVSECEFVMTVVLLWFVVNVSLS